MSTIDSKANKDVQTQHDIDVIVTQFYKQMLKDPIVGFIFTDIAKIDLEVHLPIIVDFWFDILFSNKKEQKRYKGNALKKHLELNQLLNLKPGHFTRWLFLFNNAVDENHSGENAQLMKARAEMVAKSISAAISERKKGEIQLVLPS